METNYVKKVAETITQQLGGRRFKVFTGAHSFTFRVNEKNNPELQFLLPKDSNFVKDNINLVRIELTVMDLYNAYFLNDKIQVTQYEGLYWDNLEEIFTEATGLYTNF